MSLRVLECSIVRGGGGPAGAVRHLFVYGTLRDDDDSGARWGARLLYGGASMPTVAPAAVRGYALMQAAGVDWPVVVPACAAPVSAAGEAEAGVRGRLLGWPDGAVFEDRLHAADLIEGGYERTLVAATRPRGGDGAGGGDEEVPAYMYVPLSETLEGAVLMRVPRGDWLRRARPRPLAATCADAARELHSVLLEAADDVARATAGGGGGHGAGKVVAKGALVARLGELCRDALPEPADFPADGGEGDQGPSVGQRRLHALQAVAVHPEIAAGLFELRSHLVLPRGRFERRPWGAALLQMLTRVAGLMLDIGEGATSC